jgi:CDP-glucose 4,6-dehydratase
VIGGGDVSPDRLVPDCLRAFAEGEAVMIRNPAATRPWQHVLEPLCGYLLLAERLCEDGQGFAEAWNFGPPASDVRPVAELVGELARLWGDDARWHACASDPSLHEAGLLAVDAAKARERLQWRPFLDLAQSLDWTMRWHRGFLRGENAFALVEHDIMRYCGTELVS